MRTKDWAMTILVVAFLGLAFAPVAVLAGAPTEGPSFSCASAGNAVERAICASPSLSAEDRTMAALYAMAKLSAFGKGPSNERAAQRATVDELRKCDRPGGAVPLTDCLEGVYAHRNNDLAIALALRAPDRVLPIIRRDDPPFAPIIEAIGLWASEPRDADWSMPERAAKRARILSVLAPATDIMFARKDAPWGRDILGNGQDGVSVKAPDDLFRSDRHFAFFLNALGPYLPGGLGDRSSPFDRNIPCVAIVRHPALLGATTSLFGSTLDNFVFFNDCGATAPPLPRLVALSTQLDKDWPDCQGTIRFAAYRAAGTAYDEARLGLAPHTRDAWPRERYGVGAAALAAVRTELADYYATYLGKTAAAAAVMADDALKGIFATTHQCE